MIRRLKDLTANHRARTAIAGVFVISLLGSAMAVAEEGDGEPAPTVEGETHVEEIVLASPLEFFPDPGVVVFSLPDDDGMFVDCSEAIITVNEDESITVDPVECIGVWAIGPQGQVNHGQIVKAYVHGLKDSGYEGPRGHLIREAAKSSHGKGDQQVKPDKTDDEEGEGEVGIESTSGNSKSRGRGHAKRS